MAPERKARPHRHSRATGNPRAVEQPCRRRGLDPRVRGDDGSGRVVAFRHGRQGIAAIALLLALATISARAGVLQDSHLDAVTRTFLSEAWARGPVATDPDGVLRLGPEARVTRRFDSPPEAFSIEVEWRVPKRCASTVLEVLDADGAPTISIHSAERIISLDTSTSHETLCAAWLPGQWMRFRIFIDTKARLYEVWVEENPNVPARPLPAGVGIPAGFAFATDTGAAQWNNLRLYPDTPDVPASHDAWHEIPHGAASAPYAATGEYGGEKDGDTAVVAGDGSSAGSQRSRTRVDGRATALEVTDLVYEAPAFNKRSQLHYLRPLENRLDDGDYVRLEARLRMTDWDNAHPMSHGAARSVVLGFVLPFGIRAHVVSLGIMPDKRVGGLRMGLVGYRTLEREGFARPVSGVDPAAYHTYAIEKDGFSAIRLYFDGQCVQTLPMEAIYQTPDAPLDAGSHAYFGAGSGRGRSVSLWDWVRWEHRREGTPARPRILGVHPRVDGGAVTLAFMPVRMAKRYVIRYGASPGELDREVTGRPGFVETVTGLENDTPYYFTVAGRDADGRLSPPSKAVKAVPRDRRHDWLPQGAVIQYMEQNQRDDVYVSYRTDQVMWLGSAVMDKTNGRRDIFFPRLWNRDYTLGREARTRFQGILEQLAANGVAYHGLMNINKGFGQLTGGPVGKDGWDGGFYNPPFDYNWPGAVDGRPDWNHPIVRNYLRQYPAWYLGFTPPPMGFHFDDPVTGGGGATLASRNIFNAYLNSHLGDAELAERGITKVWRHDRETRGENTRLNALWETFRTMDTEERTLIEVGAYLR